MTSETGFFLIASCKNKKKGEHSKSDSKKPVLHVFVHTKKRTERHRYEECRMKFFGRSFEKEIQSKVETESVGEKAAVDYENFIRHCKFYRMIIRVQRQIIELTFIKKILLGCLFKFL
jgi:hypothetical protein